MSGDGSEDEVRYESPTAFAATVTGRTEPLDSLHAGVVTEAMVEVFLGTYLPDDYDPVEGADAMRAVVESADLQIGGFAECAGAAAVEITDRVTDDEPGGTNETRVWDGPEAAGGDTRVWEAGSTDGATVDSTTANATASDDEGDEDEADDTPPVPDPDTPVTADRVISVVFDVTIEDVSEMLTESGELVEEQRAKLEERGLAGGLDRDREGGIGR